MRIKPVVFPVFGGMSLQIKQTQVIGNKTHSRQKKAKLIKESNRGARMKNYQVFKKPYILVEDCKGKHQPFYKEYAVSDIPKLHLNSPTLCCPFQVSKRYKPSTKRRQTKEGFCEVCYVRFSNYEDHVKDFEHREFAKDANNYKRLDVFISTAAFEVSDEEYCVPQSPTFKMTPVSSGGKRFVNVGQVNDGKYGQTLHFSRASTDDDVGQEVVPFDHFIMEILNK